jgi:hypothetical protein
MWVTSCNNPFVSISKISVVIAYLKQRLSIGMFCQRTVP